MLIDLFLFNPLAAMFASTTALALVAWVLSSRRRRTILACLLILSPGTPLFLASFVLTVARLLVWWLTRKMPNAAAMSRALVRLENEINKEVTTHEPDQHDRSKVLRFPQRRPV